MMSSWEDTVMTLDQYNMFELDFHQTNNIMELYSKCEFLNRHETEKLKRQAEITGDIAFKAGIEEAQNRLHSTEVLTIAEEALKEARLAGIKEVAEWVDKNMWKQGSIEKWQSQKKEWGS